MKNPHDYPTFRELAESWPTFLLDRWNAMSDDEKRADVQDLLDHHDGNFAPTTYILLWLFEQAGVVVP